jgi:hypothetical protein
MLMLDRTASLTGPVLMITSSPVRISTATTDSGNASSDVHPAKSGMVVDRIRRLKGGGREETGNGFAQYWHLDLAMFV